MLRTGDKVKVKVGGNDHLAVIVRIVNDAIFVRLLDTDEEQVGDSLRVSRRNVELIEE